MTIEQKRIDVYEQRRALQRIVVQMGTKLKKIKTKITCCFCGDPCIRIHGESEWVKCGKCGELYRK